MLTEPTIEKLHLLHLGAMAAAWTSGHLPHLILRAVIERQRHS